MPMAISTREHSSLTMRVCAKRPPKRMARPERRTGARDTEANQSEVVQNVHLQKKDRGVPTIL
jgi:hypothetical protein